MNRQGRNCDEHLLHVHLCQSQIFQNFLTNHSLIQVEIQKTSFFDLVYSDSNRPLDYKGNKALDIKSFDENFFLYSLSPHKAEQ